MPAEPIGLYRALRPLLFRLSPETAHRLAEIALARPFPWSRLGPGRGELAAALADPRLHVELGPFHLRNPIGLAPGLDKDGRMLPGLQHLGFAYLVSGSVVLHPRRGNPPPRLARDVPAGALINRLGLPSRGAEAFARAVMRADRLTRGARPLRIVSVAGFSPDEYFALLRQLEPLADAIEVEPRCPNVGEGEDLYAPRAFEPFIRRFVAAARRPVFVKLQGFEGEEETAARLELAQMAERFGVAGLSVGGTRPCSVGRFPGGAGRLSGAPLLPHTLRAVRLVYEATGGRLPLRAVGGVTTGADAFDLIAAGATTVELLTAFVYRGWEVAPAVAGELLDRLDAAGCPSIRELRGSAAQARDLAPPRGPGGGERATAGMEAG